MSVTVDDLGSYEAVVAMSETSWPVVVHTNGYHLTRKKNSTQNILSRSSAS